MLARVVAPYAPLRTFAPFEQRWATQFMPFTPSALPFSGFLPSCSPLRALFRFFQWFPKILNNEKYLGDVVLGKTQVRDGVQVENTGSNAKTVLKGHHPAIISKDLFELVQKEKGRRCRSHER